MHTFSIGKIFMNGWILMLVRLQIKTIQSMFFTLCFPIRMIKCAKNQRCALIKVLLFVIYLQLHL